MESNFIDSRLLFGSYNDFDEWSYSVKHSYGQKINFLHLNIRSMSKHWDTLCIQLVSSEAEFDIIILSEVFCDETQLALFNLPGYTKVFKLRDNKEGGGLVMYIKNAKLNYTHITINNISSYEHITGELEMVGWKDPVYKIAIHAVYRPPSASSGFTILQTLGQLNNTLRGLSCYKNLLFIGDTNINSKDIADINVINYESTLAGWGLERGVWDFTREEVRTGVEVKSCIDHIYYRLSTPLENIFTGVIRTKISDHYPIVASLQFMCEGSQRKCLEKVNKLDEYLVNVNLQREQWNIAESRSVNLGFEELIRKFHKIYEKSTITLIKRNTEQNRTTKLHKNLPVKEWMNFELLGLIRERDRIFKMWKNDPSNQRHRNLYNRLRNKLTKAIRDRKNTYYKQVFERNRNDSRKVWENVNYLLGRGKKGNVDSTIRMAMNSEIDTKDIVNGFANYFTEGVENLKHKCQYQTLKNSIGNDHNIESLCNLYVPKATPTCIVKIINRMSVNKSPGIDNIRMKDIKPYAQSLATPIATLINESIAQGIFPDCLKTSIVRPIYKAKSKKEFKNYRPIAILPSIEKIFEKYVLDCLNKYLEENNILSTRQFGFRKKRSTTQALEEFANVTNNIMNNRCHGLGLFIDFSKAFDTVEHEQIIKTLDKIGVKGKYLKWFESYLENRRFVVKALNTLSEERTIKYGVPQGSQIGPILFTLYLNEILCNIKSCHIWAYADDVLILAEHKDLKTTERKLQEDFNIFTRWAHDKGLIINRDKTCLMHFCPKNMKDKRMISIQYHDCDCIHDQVVCKCGDIELVEKTKYLGLTVDSKLTWSDHIASLHKKLRPCVAMMYKLQNKATKTVKMAVYKALFESNMRYGITVWGTSSNTHLNQISNIQKKCLKALYGNCEHIELIMDTHEFCFYNQLTPKGQYIFNIILKYFGESEYKREHQRNFNTRNIIKYFVPIPNTEYGRRLPEYIVPYLYNMLPNDIEQLPSIKVFKMRLFEWIARGRHNLPG